MLAHGHCREPPATCGVSAGNDWMNRLLRHARLSNVSLQHNGAHAFANRRALAIFGLGAIYTYIPKNACSTLRYSLAIHNGYLRPGDDPEWIHNNNAVFVADKQQLAEAKYTFVVLRCPYRRLASAYLDKVVGADALARVLVAKSRAPEDIEAVTAEDLHRLSFADFANTCLSPPSGVVDSHWYPQIGCLVYEDYDDWFSVEAFDQATETLTRRGLVVHDTRDRIAHSTTRFEKVEGSFANVPAGELYRMKRQGTVPHYESLFDDATRAKVAQDYADDIALYRDKIGPQGLMFRD
jgi:hypothetical protein